MRFTARFTGHDISRGRRLGDTLGGEMVAEVARRLVSEGLELRACPTLLRHDHVLDMVVLLLGGKCAICGWLGGC